MKKLLLIALAPLLSFASTPIEVKFLNNEDSKNGTVVFNITNTSKQDIEVLKWNTPFEKTLSADVFNVNIDGKENLYRGRAIKRANPTQSDYMLLESGTTQRQTVQISKYYEMNKRGEYNVIFDGSFKYRLLDTIDVKEAEIKEVLPKTKLFFTPNARNQKVFTSKQTAKFSGCSQKDISVLKVAHDDAIKMSKEASTAMNNAGKKTSAPRYVAWFGKADINRQKIVTDGFNKIHDAFENKNISFDCATCKQDTSMYDNTYAYVYPNTQYQVYLCGAFWNSSTTGTDTQAGTLIHEVSHFTVVVGTDDYAYGQEPAQTLAKNSPEKAVKNAENYDYFAENNPSLSMENPNGGDSDDGGENGLDTQDPTNIDNNNSNDDSTYDFTNEDKDWNSCLELKNDIEMEECFTNWENKYYPSSDDNDEENGDDLDWNWNDENGNDDEWKWDDIDWDEEPNQN